MKVKLYYAYASMLNNILEIVMKKIMSLFIIGLVSSIAYSADKLTLQLQWVTQAQFAGYYVALEDEIMVIRNLIE